MTTYTKTVLDYLDNYLKQKNINAKILPVKFGSMYAQYEIIGSVDLMYPQVGLYPLFNSSNDETDFDDLIIKLTSEANSKGESWICPICKTIYIRSKPPQDEFVQELILEQHST